MEFLADWSESLSQCGYVFWQFSWNSVHDVNEPEPWTISIKYVMSYDAWLRYYTVNIIFFHQMWNCNLYVVCFSVISHIYVIWGLRQWGFNYILPLCVCLRTNEILSNDVSVLRSSVVGLFRKRMEGQIHPDFMYKRLKQLHLKIKVIIFPRMVEIKQSQKWFD